MEIKALLRGGTTTIEDGAPLLRAGEVLARAGARALAVLRAGALVGVLTEANVRRAGPSVVPALAQYDWASLLDRIAVRQVMGPVGATVAPGASVPEAARVMTERGLDSLPVVEDGALIGIVTSDDLLEFLIGKLRYRNPTAFDHVLAICQLSEADAKVAVTAQRVAREHGARLTLLHPLGSLDRLFGAESVPGSLLARVNEVRVQTAMEELRALLAPGAEPTAACRVVTGDAAGAITAAASELRADLMVMGLRRRRGRVRMQESVVEDLIRQAPCPVLAVQEDA